MDQKNRKKTALFLCRCGTNVANFLDMEEIARWVGGTNEADVVEFHDLLCSPGGKKFFADTVKRVNPERIVVAACSPKMHEKTFQGLVEEAGMNIADVQMANIREQCAWVTKEKDQATEKAKRLITAAIHRSWLSENLERRSMEVIPDVLVIGGGIAGIEAALTAAKAGRKVYIVEKEISLGGAVIKTEEVAPNMECAPCLLAPRLAAIKEQKNITVMTNAEVTGVRGFYGNFTAVIRTRARFVDPSCIGCEACFEACPVDMPSAFHLNLGKRKAIATLFPGSVPAAAAIDKGHCRHFTDGSCDACKAACPFGSINFDQKDHETTINVGAIVIATGFDTASPAMLGTYGHGNIDNIYTISEFERLASSNGPTSGKIVCKNGKQPESIAVINCAGSLRKDSIPWCSGVCCTLAAKVGELARKSIPEAQVSIIHHDLVFPGPDQHAFYKRSIMEGTAYVACDDLATIKLTPAAGKISVAGKGFAAVSVDMVVLATGMRPSSDTAKLAEMLAVEMTQAGYLKPDHPLIHATGASLDGMYLAGCAAGPCDVSTAVTRAQATIGDALSKLVPGRKMELETMTTAINVNICAGCKLCLMSCPYKAIAYNASKKVSEVNEAICRGCGTCAATCPSGAAKAKHFSNDQILAEIGGLLHGNVRT